MKKVVKSDQVIHLWAHQSQSEARNAGRNCWYSGPVLYSYSTPVAMLHKAGKVALISSERYSVTTAGQLSAARSATSHLARFSVPYIGPPEIRGGMYGGTPADWRVKNRAHLAGLYAGAVAELEKGRRGPMRHDYDAEREMTWERATFRILDRHAETVRDYCTAFNLKAPELDPAGDAARIVTAKSATWERHAVASAARAERERAEWAAQSEAWRAADLERQRIAALEAPEKIAAWRAGEISARSLPYDLTRGAAMLRVNGDTVQTSQGAEVPVKDARRACWFILEKYNAGEAWQRNGERFPVGAFELDSVNADGEVRAGCHTFERTEVERLAALLAV